MNYIVDQNWTTFGIQNEGAILHPGSTSYRFFSSIQDALDAAADDRYATIVVQGGEYREAIMIPDGVRAVINGATIHAGGQ